MKIICRTLFLLIYLAEASLCAADREQYKGYRTRQERLRQQQQKQLQLFAEKDVKHPDDKHSEFVKGKSKFGALFERRTGRARTSSTIDTLECE